MKTLVFFGIFAFYVCLVASDEETITAGVYKVPNLNYVVNAKATLTEALELGTSDVLSSWIDLFDPIYNDRWSAASGTNISIVISSSTSIYVELLAKEGNETTMYYIFN